MDLLDYCYHSCYGRFHAQEQQMPFSQFPNISAVIDLVITSTLCMSQESQFVHFVFDSYTEMSLKEGERMWSTDQATGIDIFYMSRDTLIPQQTDKFWASQANKKNLQLLARDTVFHRTSSNVNIITS